VNCYFYSLKNRLINMNPIGTLTRATSSLMGHRIYWALGRIFVVSSLAHKHVVNLATSVFDQATDRSAFTDRTPPFKPDFMHRIPLFDFTLPSVFNFLTSLSRCCIGLMMCLIHIDEPVTRLLIAAQPSRLCVPFF
jgi:hypothetical protein